MPLPSFTFTGTLQDIIGNTNLSELVGNTFGAGDIDVATVTLVSNVPINSFVIWDGVAHRVKPVTAQVTADGITRSGEPVLLLANDAGLSVDGLQWTCYVQGMTGFTFTAPADGATIDLATVAPVAPIPITTDTVTVIQEAVEAAVSGIIDGAPGALDTLNELAAALGDDANFATTVTNALAAKQPLNADLTAISGLTTTAYGRSLLTNADAAAARANLDLGVVCPEDFGAVGDGVTDDATAVRDMFLSAFTNGGVNIHLPKGKTYASSLPIDVKNNTYVFGAGTLKCTAFHSAGMFIQLKNAVKNVTWIGPTLDINGQKNMNGFGIGDVPNSTDFVSDIHIDALVRGTRISTVATDTPPYNEAGYGLYAGGGKALSVQFRARNVYANIRTEDCDIACSVEAAVSDTRHLENVVIDLQAKDSHRTALYIAGSRDGISSIDSASYMHSLYPGVRIRLRAQGGQDGLITNPSTGLVELDNWSNAGVVTLNYASGVDLDIYAATEARCTVVRGMAAASTIRVNNALMDECQDVWDTRPIDTLTPAGTIMSDNVFEANVHAATHHGVLVRPHRDAGSPTMQRTVLDVNAWCQNGVGAITQDDAGVTDSFGNSVVYRFRDLKSSPVKEITGLSSHNAKPQWALAPVGGLVRAGNSTANNHISATASTVTAAGTTTLDLSSAQVQVFTGSTTQTVLLPTTGVKAGQSYTIVNLSSSTLSVQSSNTGAIITQFPSKTIVYTALIDTPVAASDWQITAMTASTTAGAQALAMRDTNGNLVADAFIGAATSTATAAGTTTLTTNSAQTQIFTGTSTQTCVLPTTSVTTGYWYKIVNTSTGAVTVQASGGATVATLAAGQSVLVEALAATPTLATDWKVVGGSAHPGNVTANNLIPLTTSTATAAGTTTLDITSSQVQIFTGSTTQTVKLPTTGVTAGMAYTIVNQSSSTLAVQSSNANAIITQFPSKVIVFTALVNTPTAAADWQITSMAATTATGTQTVAIRDTNGNLTADAFIATSTSTATAAGTTTLTINSAQTQVFTGSTTQTCVLPTTSVVAGQPYTIINQSSGAVTVNASGGATVTTLAAGESKLVYALAATPTLATDWRAI